MATTLTIGENYSRLAEHPEYLDQPMYQAIFSEAEIRELKVKTRKQYQDREWTWWMKLMTPVAQENLRKIHAAGGVLALGTDQTNGAAVHREMELLVAAGIAPWTSSGLRHSTQPGSWGRKISLAPLKRGSSRIWFY